MSPEPPRDILLVEDNPDDAELTTIGGSQPRIWRVRPDRQRSIAGGGCDVRVDW
jgi:hypothetical protein